MIGLEQVRNRIKILDDRAGPVRAELDGMGDPQNFTAQQQDRYNELAQALAVMIGRRMECEAWIEMLTAYPGVMRPDQLPTKANTPAYEPITETVAGEAAARWREGYHQRDAAELISALLPDAEPHA